MLCFRLISLKQVQVTLVRYVSYSQIVVVLGCCCLRIVDARINKFLLNCCMLCVSNVLQ